MLGVFKKAFILKGIKMDTKLINIMVCPLCKSSLIYDKGKQVLICKADKLAYSIVDGIPIMLAEKAESMTLDAIKQYG